MIKYETHIGREIKTTAKQHRLRRRALKRDPDAKYRMAKGAGKDSRKLTVLCTTGQVMDSIKNDPNVKGLLGTKQAHIQFGSRYTFDNC